MISTTISKTDLARRTRQVIDQARRGRSVIVKSYGEEQVAILDASDYRCLQALAAYQSLPTHPAPINDTAMAPRGLDADELQGTLAQSDGDVQVLYNRVIAAYLDGDISLGRAAQLLDVSRFDLQERFNRLGLPLRIGPANLVEAQREVFALA